MQEPLFHLTADQELLTARDVATLLKITPKAVRLRMANIPPSQRDGIQAWHVAQFPPDYVSQLKCVKKKSGLWTFFDLLQNAYPRWKPDFKFAALPKGSQLKAFKVRSVMLVYFAALEDQTQHQANCAARQKWLQEFSEACNEKTIRRWAEKIETRGDIEWAPMEAYCDRKSCPHLAARLEHRKKNRVPGETIRHFKWLCIQPDMTAAAAFRVMEMDWHDGKEIPGLGAMTAPRQPFPFRIYQMQKFAPSGAARKQTTKGKAAARRDTLPHMTRTHANLRPCELFVMDDTRINVTCLNDLSGLPVELKCYIAMEVATRRIVGWVLREGNMKATDVDALMARVLRTCGISRINAGYPTTFLFERGSVACSPQKEVFLRSIFPGRIEIKRTSMDGGTNFDGDYAQKGSGHWMGKGAIESFMRTLGNITKHIAGQRGSTWDVMPAMVGYPNNPHAGSQVKEATDVAQAARAVAYLQSHGTDTAPNSLVSCEALGIKPALLHVSKFRQAFARCIEWYNFTNDHHREGFRQLCREKANGGLEYFPESSNERWTYLLHVAEQHGKAPERISPADACLLLHKARKVKITKQGAIIQIDNKDYRFWHQDSIACAEAARLTKVTKEYIALCDPDGDLSEIYLLQNTVSTWREGDPVQFLEALPRYEPVDVLDKTGAIGNAYAAQKEVHNRVSQEIAAIAEPYIKERTEERAAATDKFIGVVTTTGSVQQVANLSELSKSMSRERRKLVERRENSPLPANPSRHIAAQDDISAFAELMKQPSAP